MAAKAPRALKAFLDPPFLLLVLLVLVPEGCEPVPVLLGEPEDPPALGVEVEEG